MRRSHQSQFHQRKSPSTTHSRSQSEASQHSIIVPNGCFERIVFPTDRTICVFQYHREGRPAESRWCGYIPKQAGQIWDPSINPWYLNVKRFMYLHRATLEDSISAVLWTTHCFRFRGQQSMCEFGRHLYVNNIGILCVMEIFRTFRADKHILHSDEYYINDVLPKLRIHLEWVGFPKLTYYYDTAYFKRLTTLVVVLDKSPLINNEWHSRWWYKYGRERNTRFYEYESAEVFRNRGTVDTFDWQYGGRGVGRVDIPWKLVKSEPHYGIYLHDNAKLIVRDLIKKVQNDYDYNHILIQSGCLVVLQSECRLTFMDYTEKVYKLREVHRNAPKNPMIILRAVPSLGESLCWGLSISANHRVMKDNKRQLGTTVHSIINVPLLGMNNRRMQVFGFDEGLQDVIVIQSGFDYGQYIRLANDFPVNNNKLRSAQFLPDEPLQYPTINTMQ